MKTKRSSGKLDSNPGTGKWRSYINTGPFIPKGKKSWQWIAPEGKATYDVSPIVDARGRFIGYGLYYRKLRGKWHEIGDFKTERSAKSAAKKHYGQALLKQNRGHGKPKRHSEADKKGGKARRAESLNPTKTNKPVLVKIYDNIEAIEARKGTDSLWPNEKFRHDFKGKHAAVYGLPDGSLLIKGKKRLWKKFKY